MKNSKNYNLSDNLCVLNLQRELLENRLFSLSAELEICSSYQDKLKDDRQGLLYVLTNINGIEDSISNIKDVLSNIEEHALSIEKVENEKVDEIKGELENV